MPAFRGKVISLVAAGGAAAAIFCPEMAKWSRDLLDPVPDDGTILVPAPYYLR